MAVPTISAPASLWGTTSTGIVAWPSCAADEWLVIFVATANQTVSFDLWDSENSIPYGSGFTFPVAYNESGTGTAGGTTAIRGQIFMIKGLDIPAEQLYVNDAGDHSFAVYCIVSGAAQGSTPVDVRSQDTAASSTSVSIPGLTPTGIDRAILSIVFWATDTASAQASSGANADLSSFSEIYDAGNTAGNGSGMSIFKGVKASPAAVGVTTCTLATASVQHRHMIAFMPPPAANNNQCVMVG